MEFSEQYFIHYKGTLLTILYEKVIKTQVRDSDFILPLFPHPFSLNTHVFSMFSKAQRHVGLHTNTSSLQITSV